VAVETVPAPAPPAPAHNSRVADIAIHAVNLKKVYRLYAKPAYRFLDMFGLLGNRPGAFTEHAALDGITLEIRRGEKVAIIGRNGAGKSTFLKLVTNVIQPTAGSLEVKGDVHALLQIGTGFHPDFTGRQNVQAYLAQLGVTGAEADRRCAEAVAFAELEEYIDQPVKTYSTGMAMRLMFSASTAISPDLLVLDEVLGVGDAYFAQKSYDRMRDLCERHDATLLLVTHDVYTAVRMCERVIWFDRGRVLLDGNGAEVVKAYENSIRLQEEYRLRLKKQQRLQELRQTAPAGSERVEHVLLELSSTDGRPQPGVLYFGDVALVVAGERVAAWPLDAGAFDAGRGTHLEREGSSWGEMTVWRGRACWPMLNYGTSFHKVAGVFAVPAGRIDADAGLLACSIEYASPEPCDVTVRLFVRGREWSLGRIIGGGGEWATYGAPISDRPDGPTARPLGVSGAHGTGAVTVTGARFVADDGRELHVLEHGRPARLEIDYAIFQPDLHERCQVVLALHKDGIEDVCRYITRDLCFDARHKPRGTISLTIPRLTLTNGSYAVTIMIAREGYYDTDQTVFYSINPSVYCCVSRLFDVSVVGLGLIGTGTRHVLDGVWSLE
jgi:ABC-type polysaccharide/polyol phosphate transport system ATPase subunit